MNRKMNRKTSKLTGCILGLGLLLAAGQPAQAVQAVWDNTFTPAGWTRGSTIGSHYAEWNIFSNENGLNVLDTTPDVSVFGGGSYRLEETNGTGIITGSSNIYSFAGPQAFTFTANGLGGAPSDTRNVYLRFASVGNFDPITNRSYSNFTLNGIGGAYMELFRSGATQGTEVEAVLSWTNVSNALPLTFGWNGFAPHISLDQLSLDVSPVAAVPLPAAAYLMASGIVSIAAMARRRQRAV